MSELKCRINSAKILKCCVSASKQTNVHRLRKWCIAKRKSGFAVHQGKTAFYNG